MRSAPALLSVFALACLGLVACGGGESDLEGSLVIDGSAWAPGAPSMSPLGAPPGTPTGDPASLLLGMYSLYVGKNADCSQMTLVEDHGATPKVFDMVQNPVLFSVNPANGSYLCVALRMSDVLTAKSKTSFGSCVAGVAYTTDVYRAGQTGWVDTAGAAIVGHGTSAAPVDDHVTIVLTTDPAAAIAHGYLEDQVIALGSKLLVPSKTTLFWGGAGTVTSTASGCGIEQGSPKFQ